MKTYNGGCHCGAVRFQVELDLGEGAGRCNCTICTMMSATTVSVKPGAFKLLSGEENLTDYRRGDSPLHYPFCKTCGIHAFGSGHLKELGGDYVSINVNCLDGVDPIGLRLTYWDGRHDNWHAGPRAEPWPIA